MAAMRVPKTCIGIRLCKVVSDDLRMTETVEFPSCGWVDTVLRRGSLPGKVEVDAEIDRYFADLVDANGGILATVSLDRDSFRALKTKWMRCKYVPLDSGSSNG